MATTKVRITESGLLGRFKVIHDNLSSVAMFSEAAVDMPHFEEVLGAFTKALRLPSTKGVLGFLPAHSLRRIRPDGSSTLNVSLKLKGGPMTTHDQINQILYTLGRIEGQLIEINSLSKRLSMTEMSLSWIKGGWAMLVAAVFYLYRLTWGKP